MSLFGPAAPAFDEKNPGQFEARPGPSHRAIQCCKPRRFEGLLNTTQLASEPVQRRPPRSHRPESENALRSLAAA
jgi:hypothetical protein